MNEQPFLLLYIRLAAIAATALTLTTLLTSGGGLPGSANAIHAVVITAMVVITRRFPIEPSPKAKLFADSAALLAAVLLLPPELAVVSVMVAVAISELRARDTLQFTFNVSQAVSAVAAASLIYRALQPDGFATGGNAGVDVAAVALAALVLELVNCLMVEGILALQNGSLTLKAFVGRRRLDLPHQVPLYCLGAMAALSAFYHPITLPLLMAPAALAYFSLRDRLSLARRSEMQKELTHMALFDQLTGLPNRMLFMNRLERTLARAQQKKTQAALLFLDIDRFKLVNDSLGHSVGDQLLKAMAERLDTAMRPGDTVARFSGDEFAVLLERLSGPSDAVAIVERLCQRLEEPFTLDGRQTYATASIGVVLIRSSAAPAEDLLRDADVAMYRAKSTRRGSYVIFDSAMSADAAERMDLESDLRLAIERCGLELFYQPEVELESGRVVAAEALVRWRHPTKGFIPPGEFVALAEDSGLIVPLGSWILREACRQAAAWRHLGLPQPLKIGVNVSARQLQRAEFSVEVAEIVRESELRPQDVRVEITESVALGDSPVIAHNLRSLKELGFELAMDDFGTGYSSLTNLNRLMVDTLKIDRSFIDGLESDDGKKSIVRALVTLGQNLGMVVVAEGAETAAQVRVLRRLGCPRAQGFYFSHPIDEHRIIQLLHAGPLAKSAKGRSGRARELSAA